MHNWETSNLISHTFKQALKWLQVAVGIESPLCCWFSTLFNNRITKIHDKKINRLITKIPPSKRKKRAFCPLGNKPATTGDHSWGIHEWLLGIHNKAPVNRIQEALQIFRHMSNFHLHDYSTVWVFSDNTEVVCVLAVIWKFGSPSSFHYFRINFFTTNMSRHTTLPLCKWRDSQPLMADVFQVGKHYDKVRWSITQNTLRGLTPRTDTPLGCFFEMLSKGWRHTLNSFWREEATSITIQQARFFF